MRWWTSGALFALISTVAECAGAQDSAAPPAAPAPPAVASEFPAVAPAAPVPVAPASPSAQAPVAPVVARPQVSSLEAYRARELYTRFQFWSGQVLMRGGERVDLGYFGGNADSVFAGSEAALDHAETFRTMRITGTTLYVVGLAMLVTEAVLLSTRSEILVEKDSSGHTTEIKPLALGLFIPGIAAGLTGGLLMQAANGPLSDAVDSYNADLARKLERQSLSRGLSGPMLRLNGVF
jgi:hypothetical protein